MSGVMAEAAASAQRGSAPFIIGGLVYLCLFMGVGALVIRAQFAFLRLYRSVRHIDLPFPSERVDQFFENPPRWYVDSFNINLTALNALLTQQPEPEVERARRSVLWRIALCTAVMLLGAPALIFLTTV